MEALYQDVLGRGSDPGGRANYVAALAAGTSREDVVRAFLGSEEYLTRHVEAEYRRWLRRSADPAAYGFVSTLQQGAATFEDLAVVLAASEEYRAYFPPSEGWVRQLYRDALGREGEVAGVQAHSQSVADSGDFAGVARAFLASAEHHERWADAAWRRFLRRDPSAAERDAERRALDGGDRLEETWVRVLTSREYYERR